MKLLSKAVNNKKCVVDSKPKSHSSCEVECVDTYVGKECKEVENKEGS